MVKVYTTDNKRFVEISIEGDVWKVIDKRLYSRHLGKIRACQDKKELSDLFSTLELQVAKGYVYKLLAVKGFMENQLRKKLKERYFDEPVIEAVLTHCRASGYVDDTREAKLFVEREKRRGKGPRVIGRRLQEKSGGSESLTSEAFSEEEQKELIQKLLERRFPDLSETKTKQRAYRFLERRGFSQHLIRLFLFEREFDF